MTENDIKSEIGEIVHLLYLDKKERFKLQKQLNKYSTNSYRK